MVLLLTLDIQSQQIIVCLIKDIEFAFLLFFTPGDFSDDSLIAE